MSAPLHNQRPLPAPPAPGADSGWALFLDIDGTLLDFAPYPDAVHVDDSLIASLHRLHAMLGGAVALLSGRTLHELDTLFGWRQGPAAGLHGAQLRYPDGRCIGVADDDDFASLCARAQTLVARNPGVLLEDKFHALALHYRNAPHQRAAVERIAQRLLDDAGDGYTLQHGDHVVELKPADADKGRALSTLMDTPTFSGRRPWMLGDDLTDEHAFEQVNTLDGFSAIVGARSPTRARYALDGPGAVRAWLQTLTIPPQ